VTVGRSTEKPGVHSRQGQSHVSEADLANTNRPQSISRSRSNKVAATPSDGYSEATKAAVIGRGKEKLSVPEPSNSDAGESDDNPVIWVQRRPPNQVKGGLSRSVSSTEISQKPSHGSRSRSRTRIGAKLSGDLEDIKDMKCDTLNRISETPQTDGDYVPSLQKTASSESKYVPQSISL
jgi:hypothetical protein